MAKQTGTYESVIVISTAIGEEQIKALVEKFSSLISANGTLDSTDEWGKRRLAYAINDETDGYYVMFTYTSKTEFPAELERVLGITDGVMRYLTITKA